MTTRYPEKGGCLAFGGKQIKEMTRAQVHEVKAEDKW